MSDLRFAKLIQKSIGETVYRVRYWLIRFDTWHPRRSYEPCQE